MKHPILCCIQACVPQSHELDGHMNSNENTEYAKNCPCSLGNAHALFHVDKLHTLCKMQLSFKCSEILNLQVKASRSARLKALYYALFSLFQPKRIMNQFIHKSNPSFDLIWMPQHIYISSIPNIDANKCYNKNKNIYLNEINFQNQKRKTFA
jgi:hypothetical protein